MIKKRDCLVYIILFFILAYTIGDWFGYKKGLDECVDLNSKIVDSVNDYWEAFIRREYSPGTCK